jgi:hypothetical protein
VTAAGRGAYRALLDEHAAELLDEPSAAQPAHAPPPAEYPARVGARDLDASSRRVLQRGTEQPTVRPWARTAAHAIIAWWESVREGASLRSTCDPDRANRVQTSADPSLGGREHDRIERLATVARAVSAARDRVLLLSEACPTLTAAQAHGLGLMLIVRRDVEKVVPGRKATFASSVEFNEADALAFAREEWGAEVSRYEARAAKGVVLDVVRRALEASGELRPVRAREPERRGFAADPGARVRA